MKIILLIVTLGIIIIFSSCQKEVDGSLINRTQSDSSISKLVILDTAYASGIDTQTLILITYDGNARLSKMSNIDFTAGTAIRESVDDYYYNYTGNDTVPYRLLEDYQDLLTSSFFRDTAYYFYQNGVLVKDSATEFNGYYVNTYTKLSATRCRTIKLQIGLPPSFADTCFSYVNWQNGNLVAETDSEYSFQPPVLINVSNNYITYDTKLNPLRKLCIPYPVPLYPAIIFNQYLVHFGITPSVNNVLSWQDDFGSSTVTYVYNSAGLPKIARSTLLGSTAKIMYYYTML